MTCKECEKSIYLYKELDPAEKKNLDAHISTCTSCSKVFERFHQAQSVIESLKPVPEKFENTNPFLTSRILTAIQAEKSESILGRFLPFVRFSFVRNSMAMASVALFIFFLLEIRPNESVVEAVSYYKKLPITKTVRLNSVAFREQLQNSIKSQRTDITKLTLSKCLAVCKEDDKQEACEECQTALNKIRNEGI